MNQDEHKKIEQNISFMKERLVKLDPLIEKLTRRGVFKFEDRHQIVKYSTDHRRFNEFIKKLKASPNRDAFVCFLEALNADGHNAIVQKVQNTVPRQVGFVKTPGKVTVPEPQQITTQPKQTPPPTSNSLLRTRPAPSSSKNLLRTRATPSTPNTAVESRRWAFAERVSTVPSKDVDYPEPGELKTVLDLFQQKQNIILDKRVREMKQEQHDYMQEFSDQWKHEKRDLMKEISILKRQFDSLKDKYDHLSARGTKNSDRLFEERGGDLKRSNEDLQNRCSKLSDEKSSLQQECKRLNEKVDKQQAHISDLLQKQKEAESLGPQVIVGEDVYGSGADQDYGYATAYGSQRKDLGKR
ncbi:uncharacterized protein LOC110456068 [Mizuhopecten yessoensis]|uniref:CARD domain-containing protein n=1 Tax=Mizuhopecten yessoensis TaxID=6573 RepID=A0A210R3Y5_MIZYE|nr:uncharacterized protein LOC110456068 [Mizuhopecten yessoensis]OWF55717.1 hypothetical protein KP79_PYT11166 [Mizuhopecten yessoensis]